MIKNVKDLKKGDVIRFEYGREGNIVTGKFISYEVEEHYVATTVYVDYFGREETVCHGGKVDDCNYEVISEG